MAQQPLPLLRAASKVSPPAWQTLVHDHGSTSYFCICPALDHQLILRSTHPRGPQEYANLLSAASRSCKSPMAEMHRRFIVHHSWQYAYGLAEKRRSKYCSEAIIARIWPCTVPACSRRRTHVETGNSWL